MIARLKILAGDSLLYNSFFLIMATGVVAGLGFIFWLIAARIFSPADIGLATTLISVMNMIGLLSLFGFDVAFIRFLPTSKQRDKKINTGLVVASAAAFVFSVLFLLFIPSFAPSLSFIREHTLNETLFVVFCMATALGLLVDSIFVAMRQAHYSLLVGIINWCARLVLPFVLAHRGAAGLFIAFGCSQIIALGVSIAILVVRFSYRPRCIVHIDVLKIMGGYSLINYVGGIFNLLPVTLLPIIIVNQLGAAQAAFFYIAMLFANLLYAIPWSITRALFAEGAHDTETLVANSIRSARLIALIMIPAMVVYLCGGGYLLHLFGKAYSAEGFAFLRILAISGVAVGAYAVLGSFFRITKDSRWLMVINGMYAATIIGCSYLLLSWGLVGIGVAWLLGNGVACAMSYAVLRRAPDIRIKDQLPREEAFLHVS